MKPARVIIFAKAPQPGRVKTRLHAALGPNGAAELAARMLMRTLNAALQADVAQVELCASPAVHDPAWGVIALPAGIQCSVQGDGDLGERMERAATRCLDEGAIPVLIGTDCIEMCAPLIDRAIERLHTHDAIIHPTCDGGYALLGLHRPAPSVFRDIAWSTAQVATLTLQRLGALGWNVCVAETLHDVDEPADLNLLPPDF